LNKIDMKYFYFITFLFLPVYLLDAQEMKVVSDLRFNGEIGIEKSFFNHWKAGMETQLKLERNVSRIDEIDLDLNLECSPFKFLSVGAGYRIALNQKRDSTFEKKYRFYADMQFEQGIDRFKLDYRIRYQNIDDDFFQYEQQQPSRNILRNRLHLRYNIRNSPVEPFTYVELYGLLNKYEEFASKIKFAAGARYNLRKYGKLQAYYRIDRELNSLYPYTFYTIGIGYVFEF